MNTLKYDAVVIGQGLAGFSCAMSLKEKGLKVAIVAKSVGATAVSSGSWDLGSNESYTDLLWEKSSASPLEDSYQEAIKTTQMLAKDLAFHTAPIASPVLLPSSAGYWKSSVIYQNIHSGSELNQLNEKKVGLLVSKQWRWPGELIAKRLIAEAKRHSFNLKLTTVPIEMETSTADIPLSSFATRLRASMTDREFFFRMIQSAIGSKDFDILIIPPLFLSQLDFLELKSILKIPVSECLSTVEPVAGYRLHNAIKSSLQSQEICVHSLDKTSFTTHNNRIRKIYLDNKTEIEASHFILATGKLFGGGIELGYDQIQESVFNLPVFWSRTLASIKYRSQIPWQRTHFEEAQPWAKLGLWVNSQFQPLDDSKEPVYSNLYACGSIIGGVDFGKDKCGLGMMASMGRMCAHAIS